MVTAEVANDPIAKCLSSMTLTLADASGDCQVTDYMRRGALAMPLHCK